MNFTILGMGTAVPPIRVPQTEAAAVAQGLASGERDSARLAALYRQTEIGHRHMVPDQAILLAALEATRAGQAIRREPTDRGPGTAERMALYERHAEPLAIAASSRALADARVLATDITHLVTVSCTGFAAPGFDIGITKALGLPRTVRRAHLGFMGCHGALNALDVARGFCDSCPGARVLLCATELCSLHYHYAWDTNRAVGNALFADGAAALVGGAGGSWRLRANGSCLFADSEAAMRWSVGDHGFEMTLSPRVPGLIARHLAPWLDAWLAHLELEREDIATWAIHPGGPRIVSAVEESLGLARTQTAAARAILADYGNMSSATILFILDLLRRESAPLPCLAMGFGPGLVAEAALFI